MKTAYLCLCRDSLSAPELRAKHLQDHFSYIETITDQLLVAGPLKNADGEICGSCLIFNADTEQQALQILHADPYFAAGVWREVECQQLTLAAGSWAGGINW